MCWKERPCSLHRGLAEADVCDGPDGVYQLALKFSPMKPGGTGYRVLFIKRTFQLWMVIDEFYQRTCHVTLGSNVTKLHSALERKPCTSYQTYFSFPSPAPFPPRMRTRKNTDGLRDYQERCDGLAWTLAALLKVEPLGDHQWLRLEMFT